MKILLDTNMFLWFITNNARLSRSTLNMIADLNNTVLISPASYWEIAIKVSIGKYPLTVSFQEFVERGIVDNQFTILPIRIEHASVFSSLPYHHRDPFDRMIIAQAIAERIAVVSSDAIFDQYPVTRIS